LRALAQHYSTWDSDRVFLEILNEPEFTDRYRWLGVQVKLAAAIGRARLLTRSLRQGGAGRMTTNLFSGTVARLEHYLQLSLL